MNARSDRSARPAVESLEDRLVLSTASLLDVNTTTLPSLAPYTSPAPATLGDYTYFAADDGSHHNGLFRTNGTGRGTTLVKDVGGVSTTIANLTVVGNRLFFTADDGAHGNELWVSDGTAGGTRLVKDINTTSFDVAPGVTIHSGSTPRDLTAYNGKLYFTADDATTGRELWVSDGTVGGTHLVVDLDPTSGAYASPIQSPVELTVYKNRLFFFASDGSHGAELFSSDGTAEGTHLVKDINPGASSSQPSAYNSANPGLPSMTVAGRYLLFSATDGSHGTELWRSDGTARGTLRVRDINSGREPTGIGVATQPRSSTPMSLTTLNGVAYFIATDGSHGYELWRSNGEARGTWMVLDALPGDSVPHSLVAAGGKMYFVTSTDTFGSERLWVTDGTTAGSVALADLPGSPYFAPDPNPLVAVGNTVYFGRSTPQYGRELWSTNGTGAGTHMVADVRPGAAGSETLVLGKHFDRLLFGANNGRTGLEMWISNNTAAGTALLRDLNTGNADSNPGPAVQLGNKTLFVADDGRRGAELWVTDGTAGGTKIVRDINTTTPVGWDGTALPAGSSITGLTRVGNWVYFSADDGIHGAELWRSDGTTSGTRIVKDINVRGSSNVANLTEFNGKVYFTADDGVHGLEVWVSDGTARGTRLVVDLNTDSTEFTYPPPPVPPPPGSTAASYPDSLVVFDGHLYFTASDGQHGRELFRTDGTAAGTELVKDIYPDDSWPFLHNGSDPRSLTVVGDTLYFSATDGAHGRELWKSDGTAAGTVMVKDLMVPSEWPEPLPNPWPGPFPGAPFSFLPPGPGSYGSTNSNPEQLTALGGTLYFVAADADTDRGLWKTDGTEAGTVLVKSLEGVRVPFGYYGGISQLTAAEDRLYFVTMTEVEGEELWVSDGTSDGTHLVKDIFPGQDPYGFDLYIYANNSSPQPLVAVGKNVYFFAQDADHGRELWRSDGTGPGTVMVQDINPSNSPDYLFAHYITVAGNRLFFQATDGRHGVEAWLLPLT